jgi:hypothetical protein
MAQALNGVSAALASVSFIFYIVGCVGYSSNRDGIKSTNWINYSVGNTDDYFNPEIYIGLRKVLLTFNSNYNQIISFKSCADGDDDDYDDYDDDDNTCDICYKNGQATFGLLVVAAILAFVVICLSGATAASPNAPLTYVNLVCSFISGLFGVIGFGLFMHSCYNKFDDDVTETLHYGPGAIMSLVAFLLMWLVIVLQIAASAMGGGAAKAQ